MPHSVLLLLSDVSCVYSSISVVSSHRLFSAASSLLAPATLSSLQHAVYLLSSLVLQRLHRRRSVSGSTTSMYPVSHLVQLGIRMHRVLVVMPLTGWSQTWKNGNTQGFLWMWKTQGILREFCATSGKNYHLLLTVLQLWPGFIVFVIRPNPVLAKYFAGFPDVWDFSQRARQGNRNGIQQYFWNKLPDYLRNPSLSIDIFSCDLKTFLFAQYWLTMLECFRNC